MHFFQNKTYPLKQRQEKKKEKEKEQVCNTPLLGG